MPRQSLDIPVRKPVWQRFGSWFAAAAFAVVVAAAYWGGYYPGSSSANLERAGSDRLFRPIEPMVLIQKTRQVPPDSLNSLYEPVSTSRPDSFIQYIIKAQFERNKIPHKKVDVRVDRGRVVLTGRVSKRGLRDRAELLARKVDGVSAVSNRIQIRDRSSR